MITFRATLLLLVTAPLWAVSNWIPAFQWIALGYFGVVIGVFLVDRRAAGDSDQFQIERVHDSRLSLGADNRVQLAVRNRQRRAVTFWLRDEPPDEWVEEAGDATRRGRGACDMAG